MSRKHLRLGAVITAVVAALFVGLNPVHAEDSEPGGDGESSAKTVAARAELLYRSVTPCRIVDTRHGGGGALSNDSERTYSVRSGLLGQGASLSDCGVPDGARSITGNVTITGTSGFGNLRVFPANASEPNASTINWSGSGVTIANEVGIGLNSSEQFKVRGDIGGGGQTHVIVDVTGFYVEQIEGWFRGDNGAVHLGSSNRILASSRSGVGQYTITVSANLNACGISADTFGSGYANVNWSEGTGTVFVTTRDSAGAAADRFFGLIVSC